MRPFRADTVPYIVGHRAWRHWGCTTKKILENMKKSIDSAEDLDGFEDISEENQEKLKAAWETGEVADEGWCYLIVGAAFLIHGRYT
jgi:hypothetical protein